MLYHLICENVVIARNHILRYCYFLLITKGTRYITFLLNRMGNCNSLRWSFQQWCSLVSIRHHFVDFKPIYQKYHKVVFATLSLRLIKIIVTIPEPGSNGHSSSLDSLFNALLNCNYYGLSLVIY